MSDLNIRIIREIEQYRQSNPMNFSSWEALGPSDFPLLLTIVASVGRVMPSPNLSACTEHLGTHFELYTALGNAYLSRSFESLIHHRMICPPP
jgi:hypothetical protein